MYGIHIGELNAPQEVITRCPEYDEDHGESFLPPCIPMTDAAFALAVSTFTLSGLLGSMVAGKLADARGRRQVVFYANVTYFFAGLIEALSRNPYDLYLGRFFAGLGSGASIVVVPMYLSEIAPIAHRGVFGVFNQIGIVLGILFIQVLGLYLSYVPGWRFLLACGMLPSILQFVFLPFCVESPRHLALNGKIANARVALHRLRGPSLLTVESELEGYKVGVTQRAASPDGFVDDTSALLANREIPVRRPSATEVGGVPLEEADVRVSRRDHVHFVDLLRLKEYRKPFGIMILLQLTQQFSGINAVMYYSTAIMSNALPGSGALITVYISIVNVAMTFVTLYLIDRAGRRPLFLASVGSMSIVTFGLAFAMWQNLSYISALAILLYVASFSLGLGPIPFLIISEIFDARAVGSAASVGLVVNWISNFVIATAFLPLSELIGTAAVFALFGLVQLAATLYAMKILPETKGKSAEEVQRELNGGGIRRE